MLNPDMIVCFLQKYEKHIHETMMFVILYLFPVILFLQADKGRYEKFNVGQILCAGDKSRNYVSGFVTPACR